MPHHKCKAHSRSNGYDSNSLRGEPEINGRRSPFISRGSRGSRDGDQMGWGGEGRIRLGSSLMAHRRRGSLADCMDGMESMSLSGRTRRFDATGGIGLGEGLMGGLGGGGLSDIPEMSGGLGGEGLGRVFGTGLVGERVGGLRGLGDGLRGHQGRGLGGLGGGLGDGLRGRSGLGGLRGMRDGLGARMSGADMRPDLGANLRRSPNPEAPVGAEEETADNTTGERVNVVFEARAKEARDAHFNGQRHSMMHDPMTYPPQHPLRRPAGLGAEGINPRFHLENARAELFACNLGLQPSSPHLQGGIGFQGQFDPYAMDRARAAYSPFHPMNLMGGPPGAGMGGYESEMEATMQRQAAEAEMMARAGYAQYGQGDMYGAPGVMRSPRGGYFL